MRALTLDDTGLNLSTVPDPIPGGDDLLISGLLLGICGTDRGLASRGPSDYPPGSNRLILGHESLGQVLSAPPGSGFTAGDLVTALVRRPDPIPCTNCAAGDLDLCKNGLQVERGIRGQDGYAAERYLLDPRYAVRINELGLLGVLIEPTSITAKRGSGWTCSPAAQRGGP